ncbi:MAG: class II aldolase/adducin family protein, partial [Prolixibacteraceae bacterium]|nr:class II aldolase/adducin family protein [Prolixibacteraceae bacterium]
MNKEIIDLIRISRYYGGNKEFVIAGGGNTSWKDEKRLFIKASGINLGEIDESGFCILDREKLNQIPKQKYSSDPAVREEEVKNALMDARTETASGLRPSVETSLHNLFRQRYVVHTHSTLVNGLMCSRNAARKALEIFGEEVLYIPYSDPGFTLFTLIAEKIAEYNNKFNRDPDIVLIQNHGVFVAADSTDGIENIYREIEEKLRNAFNHFPVPQNLPLSEKMADILPAVRMLLSEEKLKVVSGLNSSFISRFISDEDVFDRGISKPFTPDQLVYCLSEYLFINNTDTFEEIINEADNKIKDFKKRRGVMPKVIFLRNTGVIVAEDSAVSVDYLRDIVNDFCRISILSENFGGPHPLNDSQAAFIENWEVENYRK